MNSTQQQQFLADGEAQENDGSSVYAADESTSLKNVKVLNASAFDDILAVFFENRYIVPLILILSILVGYQISVAPYHIHYSDTEKPLVDLKLVRPVLTMDQLARIQKTTLHAETLFTLPLPSHDTIAVRFHSTVSKHGNYHLPDLFYEGVTFGITGENSHDFEYTAQSTGSAGRLLGHLQSLPVKPTHIMDRKARYNSSGWTESGYAVYFSYADLERQGRLSNDDPLKPWKRVCEDVLSVARTYRQVYITVWYPSEFGHHADTESKTKDPHRYTTIVQQTLPTRTGLDGLKSTAAVWLSLVNSTAPSRPPRMYQKEWTEDDHWSMYTTPAAAAVSTTSGVNVGVNGAVSSAP